MKEIYIVHAELGMVMLVERIETYIIEHSCIKLS
mgnify:CR=1 FL=1